MKKYLLPIMLGAFTAIPAMSQNRIVDNPDNREYFGLRVGGEVTCPGKISADNVGISVFKNGGGVEFGGIYHVPAAANFYIEPGLKFFYNTYSVKDDFLNDSDNHLNFNSISFRKYGMRIPVMAGYHFDFTNDFKLYIFTGPEVEIGFSAKAYVKTGNRELSESLYGEGGDMKRVDLLWGIGAGISYQHVYFGVSGSLGMVNMLNNSEVKFYENRATFSIGYNF